MSLRALLLLSFLIPSIPISFFRPFYGVLLWTIISFANPQSYAWGAKYEFPTGVLIALPTLAGCVIFGKGWQRLMTREVGLLVILWIWFTATSLVASQTPLFQHHAVATWQRWELVSKILLMTLVAIATIDSFKRLRNLILVIAVCFAIFIVKALPFMILNGGSFRLYGPENSMIEDNNDFGLALNMTFPLFFFLARTEKTPWVKKSFAVLSFLIIPAIFATYSRGAMVGLIAVLAVMFWQSKQRMLLAPVIVMGALIAILLAPDAWKERMDPTRQDAVDESAQSRINSWTFAYNLACDYPITGGGFRTFTPRLFQIYAPEGRDVKAAHSVYFSVLAEHGFFGLFLYLTLIGSCFLSTNRVLKWARPFEDDTAMSYAKMFQFSLVGFLSSGIFLSRSYFDYFFTIVACVSILKVLYANWAAEQMNGEPDPEAEDGEELMASIGAA